MSAVVERWSLGAKLAAAGAPFLLMGLLTTALTLWVSWQLDGGAAAVNEVGRMRMQAYRLAWSTTLPSVPGAREELIGQFDASLQRLGHGTPERPTLLAWGDEMQGHYASVQQGWAGLRALHVDRTPPTQAALDAATTDLVRRIDALVSAVEVELSRYTSILHLLQVGLMVMGTMASSVLVVVGYHFVLEPVAGLKRAVAQLQAGDLSTRVEPRATDELGALAAGFNEMAERLQASYADLEGKVREKTAELQDKRERLQALYDVSLIVAREGSLNELAQAFTRRVRAMARADAAALRWADVGNNQFVMLATDGVPEDVARDEQCIRAADCWCGRASLGGGARVFAIRAAEPARLRHCERSGWTTVVAVPIRAHERLLGELNLFFAAELTLQEPERALLESMCSHLASGMENLRLQALEREAAVTEERTFLARELHDSIAQSLAFLNIQAQLMRRAMAESDTARMAAVMGEIELGLRESHGDVRELLLNFRTRTTGEDIEHALKATLRKFEHQSGVSATLTMHGVGLPLAADVQVQALHIVQEALSNVRKHARASWVWVDAWRQPAWKFRVRDDGIGFACNGIGDPSADETHVGLRIMRERAQRLGAQLEVHSHPGHGTTVTLTLPGPGGTRGAAEAAGPTMPE